MIFIDRSVPRGVADAVKRMREDVLWLEDKFPHDVPDQEWLARAGREGWLVITHDRKIRTRPGERRAIIEHGVGCFILTYRQDLKKEEILALISSNRRSLFPVTNQDKGSPIKEMIEGLDSVVDTGSGFRVPLQCG